MNSSDFTINKIGEDSTLRFLVAIVIFALIGASATAQEAVRLPGEPIRVVLEDPQELHQATYLRRGAFVKTVATDRFKLRLTLGTLFGEPVEKYEIRAPRLNRLTLSGDAGFRNNVEIISVGDLNRNDISDAFGDLVVRIYVSQDVMDRIYFHDLNVTVETHSLFPMPDEYYSDAENPFPWDWQAYIHRSSPGIMPSHPGEWGWDVPGIPGWGRFLSPHASPPFEDGVAAQALAAADIDEYMEPDYARESFRRMLYEHHASEDELFPNGWFEVRDLRVAASDLLYYIYKHRPDVHAKIVEREKPGPKDAEARARIADVHAMYRPSDAGRNIQTPDAGVIDQTDGAIAAYGSEISEEVRREWHFVRQRYVDAYFERQLSGLLPRLTGLMDSRPRDVSDDTRSELAALRVDAEGRAGARVLRQIVAADLTVSRVMESIRWTTGDAGTVDVGLGAVASDGSSFVAVGSDNTILISNDGTTWNAVDMSRYSGYMHTLIEVVWDGTRFVSVGAYGSMLYSADGTTWTISGYDVDGVDFRASTPKIRGLASDGTRLVAVGYVLTEIFFGEGSSGAYLPNGTRLPEGMILHSTNGNVWAASDSGTEAKLSGVASDGRRFVAVGSDGTIVHSTDGAAWTASDSGTDAFLSGVASDGRRFVAVGSDGTIVHSTDGVAWTASDSGTDAFLSGVASDGTRFVAVGSNGTIVHSTDGAAWTASDSGTDASLHGVASDGTRFVAVGSNGTILYSSDGAPATGFLALARGNGSAFPRPPDAETEAGFGAADHLGAESGASDRLEVSNVPSLEQSKYLFGIEKAIESENYEQVLKYAGKLDQLGGSPPLDTGYYRGIAYSELGRYRDAVAVLTEYLEKINGRQGSAQRVEDVFSRLLELESILEDDEAYEAAQGAETSASYKAYLTEYPNGRHVQEAQGLLAAVQDDEAYRRTKNAGTPESYEEYLTKYPDGRHAEEAQRLLLEVRDDHGDGRDDATLLNSWEAGEIHSGDVDVFRIDVPNEAPWVIAYTTGETLLDVRVLTERGELVEERSGPCILACDFHMRRKLDPGAYYLEVKGMWRSTAGNYAVHMVIPGSPKWLPYAASGELSSAYDADVFRIAVKPEAPWITVYTTGDLNTAGTFVQVSEDGSVSVLESTHSGGEGDNFRMTVKLDPGIHYIEVGHSTPGGFGSYRVHLTTDSVQRGDHADTTDDATLLKSSIAAEMGSAGDVDVFRIEVAAEAPWVTVYTTGQVDLDGRFQRKTGGALGGALYTYAGRNFRKTRRFEPGTYYLAVEGNGQSSVGSYAIHLSALSATPVTASADREIQRSQGVDVLRIEVGAEPVVVKVYGRGGFEPRWALVQASEDGGLTKLQQGYEGWSTGMRFDPGTYFLIVSSLDRLGLSLVLDGPDYLKRYRYRVRFTADGVASDDHADGRYDAAWLRAAADGEIGSPEDVDVFRIEIADEAQWIRVYTTGDLNTAGSLVRDTGGLIQRGFGLGLFQLGDRNFHLTNRLDRGTYYLEVEGEGRATGKYKLHLRFRDCEGCPEMVLVPAGSFMMGSPSSEEGRVDAEGPQHRVTIEQALAVGAYEVKYEEFELFVAAMGDTPGGGCTVWDGDKRRVWEAAGWRWPKLDYGAPHPVVCVSWEDAQGYLRWLSEETGKEYRLLSESEWEYVARGGTNTARYWGETEEEQCSHANGADSQTDFGWAASCDDGHRFMAPAGSYTANEYGLYDVIGNVWEWTEDCWNESYEGAPIDGRPWVKEECDVRVVRGGGWSNISGYLRSAIRLRTPTGYRSDLLGFRVARTL